MKAISSEVYINIASSVVGYHRTRRSGGFTLSSLFDNGEAGTVWGNLPYYIGTTGTEESTWGDPVGLIPDASGNSADFTQSTVTARPVLGRVPRTGARNLWDRSDDLTVGVTRNNCTLESEESQDEVVRMMSVAAGRAFFYRTFTANRTLIYSVDVHVGSGASVVSMDWNSLSSSVVFDLDEGTVSSSRGTITPLSDGWYRVSASLYREAASGQAVIFAIADAAAGDYIFVRKPQVEEVETGVVEPSSYQRRISNFDITESGVPEIHYLGFDGTDDLVSTTLPAITGGTLVIAGTNGIWIDDGFNFEGGAFEIGPRSYTSGPAGILPVIGDLIVGGTFVIDRQLTAEERDKVVLKLKSMGAPGVLEMGPELLVNGDFSDGVAEWSAHSDASLSVDGDWLVAIADSSGLQYAGAYQTVSVEAGSIYMVSADMQLVEGSSVRYWVTSTGSAAGTRIAESEVIVDGAVHTGVQTLYTTTTDTNTLYLRGHDASRTGSGEARFRNISMRKLELVP